MTSTFPIIKETADCCRCHGHGQGCPACNGKGWREYEINIPDMLDDAFFDVATYPFSTRAARCEVADWVKKDDKDLNEYIAEAASEHFYEVFLNKLTPSERWEWLTKIWEKIDTLSPTEAMTHKAKEVPKNEAD